MTAPQPAPGWDEFKPTQEQINSACMSYRHDFGLLYPDAKSSLRSQAREWLHVWQKEYAYARSSQSTSDAGGGVREVLDFLDELAANAAPGRREPLNSIIIGGSAKVYAEKLRAALSNPAAADSNASAEARLREALFNLVEAIKSTFDCETLSMAFRRRLQDARSALSTHPHASDCEKHGDTDLMRNAKAAAKRVSEWSDAKQYHARRAAGSPSDRTADVTEDDLVRVIKKANVDFGGWEDGLARALLDTYKVSRP